MRVEIQPGNLSGTVRAVASKSHAHRLLIAAALSGDPAQVNIRTSSQDIEATKACLAQLANDSPVFDCGESGSTLRFMLPAAMAVKDEAVFLGSGRLPQRPVSPLKEEMESHGCVFSNEGLILGEAREICCIKGRLNSGAFTLPGNISSQYITGLLFALPLLDGDSQIEITSPLESSKYVDMTLDVLDQFGIRISTDYHNDCPVYKIPGGQKYVSPQSTSAEGDWSNIAFWVIAGILSDSEGILCTDIDPASSQGDKEIAALAEQMGGIIHQNETGLSSKRNNLNSIEIDASEIPDLVPILAVAASTANGTTRIYNAGRLRIKESDRLTAMYDCLSSVGADITEEPDGLIINGVERLNGGTVSGYNDHRVVMAMTIASTVSDGPIIIEGAEAINKSYPTFFEDFKALGGNFREL